MCSFSGNYRWFIYYFFKQKDNYNYIKKEDKILPLYII